MGADPLSSTGNPFLEMKTQMERGWAIFCPLQAELRSSSSLCAAEKRQLRNKNQQRLMVRGPLRETVQGRQTENTTEGIACGTEPQEIPLWETLPFINLPCATNREQWELKLNSFPQKANGRQGLKLQETHKL